MKIRAESVTAVAASLTAVAAVAIAAWDNVLTRQHNQLSVSPRLTINLAQVNSQFYITVRNDGIGPAFVKRMVLRYAGDETTRSYSSWDSIASRFASAGHKVTQTWQFGEDDAVAVDRSFTLLAVRDNTMALDRDGPAPEDLPDDPLSVADMLARVGVAIEYTSIYGDAFRTAFNWPVD